jgi:peroxiredoxin
MKKISGFFLVFLIITCQQSIDTPEHLIHRTKQSVERVHNFSFTEYYSEKALGTKDTLSLKGICRFIKKDKDPVFGYHFLIEFPDSNKFILYKDEFLYLVDEVKSKIKKVNLKHLGKDILMEELPDYFFFEELLYSDFYDELTGEGFVKDLTKKEKKYYCLNINYPEEEKVKISKQLFVNRSDYLPYRKIYQVKYGQERSCHKIEIADMVINKKHLQDVYFKDSWNDFKSFNYEHEFEENISPLETGTKAPHFNTPNSKGEKISLENFRGKFVLLDFWYLACPSCMEAIPHLNSLQEKYGRQGLNIIGINSFDNMEGIQQKTQRVLKSDSVKYMIAEGNRRIDSLYRVKIYPTAYLIDKSGHIIYSQLGYSEQKADSLENILEKHLGAR